MMFLSDGLTHLCLRLMIRKIFHLRDPSVKVSNLFQVFTKYASYKTGLNLFRLKDVFLKLLWKCWDIYET